MKVLPFTIAVPFDRTIIVQEEVLPYFYTHLHRHQEMQLTWIVEGEGTLIAGNSVQPFRSGEIYLLGSNMPHVFKSDAEYFEPDSTRKVHTFTIFFHPDGRLSALFNLPELQQISTFFKNFQAGIKLPAASFPEISSCILSINQSEGIDQLMQFLRLLKLLGGMENMDQLSANAYTHTNDHEGQRIGLIYNYIIQNFDKAIALDDVAALAHMTPQAFCRYFKKHTRHTYVHFLNKIRVNEACKMLMNRGNTSITTIAYRCGFNSINNFNRVFKTFTCKSPGAYAQKHHKKTA